MKNRALYIFCSDNGISKQDEIPTIWQEAFEKMTKTTTMQIYYEMT